MRIGKLCIIAGAGDLPEITILEAEERGLDFVVYVMDPENIALLAMLKIKNLDYSIVSLGKFDQVLKKLKNDKVSHAIIVGKVQKKNFLHWTKFNLKTLAMLAKMKDKIDASIFDFVAGAFDKIGVEIVNQELFLNHLLCKPGVYSKREPSKNELRDVEYGMSCAKKIAALDIGQSVVVAGRTLLAVEAIEGTDEAIKRGANYAGKKNAVVCKAMRKNQDTRFDVPSVGLQTLDVMRQNGCRVLAIEARHTFVIHQQEFFKKVNQYKMVFIAVDTVS